MTFWNQKRVFITGVCGTVGGELLRQVVDLAPASITGIDNNESELFFLSEKHKSNPSIRFFTGDIRDRDELIRRFADTDMVIHAAALKHVILCENSPRDAIWTNILGTQNVIDAARHHKIERVMFTSSDKAVNPTSVMGTSKLMAEKLIAAANAHRSENDPVFASTRFGNVLGSRGSVIPLFRRQIASGGPVTITDRRMTRFIMTLGDAVRLVIESAILAKGGETFVTKMPVVKITDLAEVMIEELAPRYGRKPGGIKITEIGAKIGEKLYEELINEEEFRRTMELPLYFVILPAFKSLYQGIEYTYPDQITSKVTHPYNSANTVPLEKEELRAYLSNSGLLLEEST